MKNQDQLKYAAAEAAQNYVIKNIEPNSIIGIGTGSTADMFIDLLAQHQDRFSAAVASSEASAKRLQRHGIEVLDLNSVSQLTYYIDGADEINTELAMIKGGGAALTREKIVAAVANQFLCIADESKQVSQLGQFPLPIEVIPMARSYVARELLSLGGNPVYREGVVTDNGNCILDIYDFPIQQPVQMEQQLNSIAGIVCHGIFAERGADLLFLSTQSGVEIMTPL